MKRWMAIWAGSFLFYLAIPVSGYAGLMNGGFDEGLSGWSVTGDVEVPDGMAVLQTGGVRTGEYETLLSQEGTLDSGDGILTFRYGFKTVGPDEVLDPDYSFVLPDSFQITVESRAFYEVVLLADQGTNGLLPFSIDLGLSPGSPVRLTFSLIDEDDGRFSRAFLEDVHLGADPVPEPATLILLGVGMLTLFAGGRIPRVSRRPLRIPRGGGIPILAMMLVLFVGMPEVRGEPIPSNVDDRVRFAFSSAVFDSRTGNLTGKVTVTNLWDQPLYPPLYLIITRISDSSVTVANPTDFTPEGFPFLDLSPLLREGLLQPGETTPPSDLSFHNPKRVRFRWDQDTLAVPDPPPAGPVIFNLCLIPGERPPVCEFSLEDFETADPEFNRIQTVPLPEMYAHERVKVFLFDEVFPPESLTVTIGGHPAVEDWDGAFTADLLLAEGANEISVIASNPDGVAASRNIRLTLDTSIPQIRILTPEPGSRMIDAVQTVTGTVDDSGVEEVILTHPGGSLPVPVRAGVFSQAVEFPLGRVMIRVEGADPAGNRGSVAVDFLRVNALEGGVTGRVFSEILGAPLAAVTVTAVPAGDPASTPIAAVSNADGGYALSDVPSGDVTLTGWREGYEPREVRVFLSGGDEPLIPNIFLTPVRNEASLAVTGVVRDTGEKPLPGVTIYYIPFTLSLSKGETSTVESLSRSTETGVDGTYLLPGLPRDPFVLHAGKAGYDPQEVLVSGGDYGPTVSILVHSMILRENPDAILLRHPAPGEILGGSGMIVGEFRPDLLDTAREIAVRVNGLPAFVVGNRFMINGLHLVSGPNELTVEVLSPDGMAASETFPVGVMLNEEPFFLLPSAESGIVPFRISVRGSPEVPLTLQVEGPAAPEVTAEAEGYAVTFSSPGIYLLEGETVIDGGTVRDRIAVAVSDRSELAPRLQDRWTAMIGALARGDLDGALENLTAEAAHRYRGLLEGMGEAGARFFSDLPGIVLVEMEDGMARARISKDDVSYPVWFARDLDGFYRIHRF